VVGGTLREIFHLNGQGRLGVGGWVFSPGGRWVRGLVGGCSLFSLFFIGWAGGFFPIVKFFSFFFLVFSKAVGGGCGRDGYKNVSELILSYL
jgi:hypothetical protein